MPSRSSFLMPLAIAAAALSLTGCDRAADDGAQASDEQASGAEALTGKVDRSKAGTELPALVLSDPSGAELELAALKGTPVLLNLWATWCVPCVVEMPMLDSLATQMDGELRVLTVSQDLSGATVVETFFAEREFQRLEPWLDQDNALMFSFSNSGMLPLTVLFNAEGREVFRVAGGYHWDGDEALALITEAIAE